METRKVCLGGFILFIFCFVMVACTEISQPDDPQSAFTSTNEPSRTATPKVVDTFTSTSLPTKTPTQVPSQTPAEAPNPTMTSTPQPTIMSSATPVPTITNRQLSIEELETYLTDLDLYIEPGFYGHVVETMYEDVNGDGVDDLIVSDYMFVGVFLWRDDHYEGALIYQGDPWKYDPGSRVTLEDWTNDGVPEIVFDYREDTGGTGVRITDWTRYVIHCPDKVFSCHVIWAGELEGLGEVYGTGGITLSRANIEHTRDLHENPALEIVSESFALYGLGSVPYSLPVGNGILAYESGRKVEGFPEFSPIESLKIFTSTKDIFVWNGSRYEWQETEILTPSITIDSQNGLEAINAEGTLATVTFKNNNDAGLNNDICQLNVDGQKIGLEFGCKYNFTQLEWQDVTGDGKEELVIIAYSGVYMDTGFDGQVDFPDKDCIHQRMIIYQQIDSELEKIGDVTGCVVESNLYGVRFEDIDDNEQVEILAADGWFTDSRCSSRFSASGPEEKQKNCWYELGYQNEVYMWNGSEFVYSGLLDE